VSDSPDYIVDIGGSRTVGPDRAGWDNPRALRALAMQNAEDADGGQPGSASGKRPWVSIRWTCCSTYSRLYRNQDATAYQGACPKCARPVRLRVGPGGTNTRFFEAS